MNGSVYLDYAAATPVDPQVATAMQPYLNDRFYNPSAAYKAAKSVRADFENARSTLAAWLGAKPSEIVMTAGATESANLAINGVMSAYPEGRIAVSAVEHAAVAQTARQHKHDIIAVDAHGAVSESALRAAVAEDTVLVCIAYADGMLGTLQPIKRLGQVIAELRQARQAHGNSLPLYFYSDASQAAAYCDMHVSRLGVDLLTLSAPKVFGPKQVGLLFVKTGVIVQPQTSGGGQERGLRSGTENVAGVIGFAEAARIVQHSREKRLRTVTELRDIFEQTISAALGDDVVLTAARQRVPHISHMSFKDVDGETLLFMLDERGIMVATGAACAANKQTASAVLLAIGMTESLRQGSIRCSFSHLLHRAQVLDAAQHIIECVQATTNRSKAVKAL